MRRSKVFVVFRINELDPLNELIKQLGQHFCMRLCTSTVRGSFEHEKRAILMQKEPFQLVFETWSMISNCGYFNQCVVNLSIPYICIWILLRIIHDSVGLLADPHVQLMQVLNFKF